MINEIMIDSDFDLAHEIFHAWLDVDSVACIGDYYTIRNVLSYLAVISEGELDFNEIDLHEDMDEEYLLVLDSMGLWVYYMKVNNEYMLYDHDVVFVHNKCNSKVISSNRNDGCNFVFFSYDFEDEDECECNGDCANCDCMELEEESDNMKGFTFDFSNEKGHSSYSFYSSDYEMVERMRQEMSKIFNR